LKQLKALLNDLLEAIRVYKRNAEVSFYQLGEDILICVDFVIGIANPKYGSK